MCLLGVWCLLRLSVNFFFFFFFFCENISWFFRKGLVFRFRSNNLKNFLLASFYCNYLFEIIYLKLSTKKNEYVGYLALKLQLRWRNTLSSLEVDLQWFTWKIFQLEIKNSLSLKLSPFLTIYTCPDVITLGYHLLPIYLL